MNKVIGIGETIVDVIVKNHKPQTATPGGSTFNALVSLARRGVPTTLVSETGRDKVGDLNVEFMRQEGIDNQYLLRYNDCPSPLSMAFINASGDAEYVFYKQRTSMPLSDAPIAPVNNGDALLFGSYYALADDTRPRLLAQLSAAKDKNVTIYYDPNFRPSHAHELERLRPRLEDNMRRATIVRGSDEDFKIIYNATDVQGEKWIADLYNEVIRPLCPFFICTCASRGVHLFTPAFHKHYPSRPLTPVSTVGAGDSFNAGVLHCLMQHRWNAATLTKPQWDEVIANAIDFSSEVCQRQDNYVSHSSSLSHSNRNL